MPEYKYNWDEIKQEFFNSDTVAVFDFMKQKLGESLAVSGNVQNHVVGWTEEKRAWKQKQLDEVQKQLDKELVKKLKVSLEDLLLNKKLLFELDARFLNILARMVQPDEKRMITDDEKKFFANYQEKASEIYKRIQIELGLPINIQKLGLATEDDIDEVKVTVIKSRDELKSANNGGIHEEPTGIPESPA
jgi:hypothetical protein